MVRSTDGLRPQRSISARSMPGAEKPGAAGDDDMGDAGTVLARQQLFRRFHRQFGRRNFELLHARRGVGKRAQPVEAFRIHHRCHPRRAEERNSDGRCRCARPCGRTGPGGDCRAAASAGRRRETCSCTSCGGAAVAMRLMKASTMEHPCWGAPQPSPESKSRAAFLLHVGGQHSWRFSSLGVNRPRRAVRMTIGPSPEVNTFRRRQDSICRRVSRRTRHTRRPGSGWDR